LLEQLSRRSDPGLTLATHDVAASPRATNGGSAGVVPIESRRDHATRRSARPEGEVISTRAIITPHRVSERYRAHRNCFVQDVAVVLAAWRVLSAQTPERMSRSAVQVEQLLEDWIERDPSLVDEGLVIVGRQLVLGSAGRLDLLGIDPAGRWVVIEIKAGTLYRETIAQALDYVASLKKLSAERLQEVTGTYLQKHPHALATERTKQAADEDSEPAEREVIAIIVGTGRDPGVERLLDLLSPNIAISALTFEVFDVGEGQQIMLREVAETSSVPAVPKPSTENKLAGVLQRAAQNGHREAFERFCEAAERHGIALRPYKRSLMFAPAANRTRCLFVIWTEPNSLRIQSVSTAFEEFFPGMTAEQVKEHLGSDDPRTISPDDASRFLAALDTLFSEHMAARGSEPDQR
jgi:hypothetical protein